MFEYKVKSINTRFENVKNQINDGLPYLQAEWAVEDLLKEAQVAIKYMQEDAVIEVMQALINELKQFLFDIQGLIERRSSSTL